MIFLILIFNSAITDNSTYGDASEAKRVEDVCVMKDLEREIFKEFHSQIKLISGGYFCLALRPDHHTSRHDFGLKENGLSYNLN